MMLHHQPAQLAPGTLLLPRLEGRKLALMLMAGACWIFGAQSVEAKLPKIPDDESITFQDDFADNGSEWTNVLDLDVDPKSGKAYIGTDPLEGSDADVWYPTKPGTGYVKSMKSMSLNLNDRPLAVYVRMRTDGLRRTDGSRVEVIVKQAKALHSPIGRLIMRPGGKARIITKNPDGKIAIKRGQGRKVKFEAPGQFHTYRMVLSRTDDNRMAVDAFVYDQEASQYVLLCSAVNKLFIAAKPFDQLHLTARNGKKTDRSYVDSVVLTTIKASEQ